MQKLQLIKSLILAEGGPRAASTPALYNFTRDHYAHKPGLSSMTIMHFRCLFIAVFVRLCAAVPSMDLTLSACSYTAENLYVVNSTEPQMMFPSGYVECTKATGTDTALCEICSCREKKIASVAGVTVAWVVCVGSGDATACTNNATSVQEFCASTNDSSGSSSCDGFSTNVGDSSSCNISEVITNGSGASADVSLTPTTTAPNTSVDTSVDEGSAESSSSLAAIDTSGSMDTSADVGSSDAVSEETSSISSKTGSGSRIDGSSSSSYNISSSVGSNSAPNLSSASSDIEVKIPTPSSEISRSQATSEDNVVPADVGTVEPAQTNTATSTEQNIIRPSDNESSNEFDTNNGASPTSDWSGTRLTAMITILCGIAAVAGIAVFVAVRRDQDRKNKELETPIDDSDSSLATPTTSSLDERYCKGRRGRTGLVDTSDNTVLASIVVIGANDDLLAPVGYSSGRQYRSFSGKMSGSYARTESVKASDGEMRLDNSYLNVAPASQLQFNISHGPSSSDLPLPTHDPIFDTSNTKVSFSSSMNSDSAHPPSERMYESEDISSDSFRRISATYSVGSGRDSVPSLEPENSPDQEANLVVSNTTRSFASSLSSIEFALRDTEASEHIHPSELGTTSSRIALSFESNFGVGSGSLSGGHRHHEN